MLAAAAGVITRANQKRAYCGYGNCDDSIRAMNTIFRKAIGTPLARATCSSARTEQQRPEYDADNNKEHRIEDEVQTQLSSLLWQWSG